MLVFTHGLVARPFSTALRASRAAPSMTDGLEVLVQEVMPATTTAPWSRTNSPPSSRLDRDRLGGTALGAVGGGGATAPASSSAKDSAAGSRGREGLLDGLVQLGVLGGGVLVDVVVDVVAERGLGVREQDAVLRALRARDRGHDGAQIQLEVLGVDGLARRRRATCPVPWRTPRRARAARRCGRSGAGS